LSTVSGCNKKILPKNKSSLLKMVIFMKKSLTGVTIPVPTAEGISYGNHLPRFHGEHSNII